MSGARVRPAAISCARANDLRAAAGLLGAFDAEEVMRRPWHVAARVRAELRTR